MLPAMAIDLPPYSHELRVHVVPARSAVIVVPQGELDLNTIGRVEQQVTELRTAGFERVVLDLRQVGFLDSSGLRMLLGLRNAARRNDHRLELIAGCREVQRVFDLTATRGLFDWRSAPL